MLHTQYHFTLCVCTRVHVCVHVCEEGEGGSVYVTVSDWFIIVWTYYTPMGSNLLRDAELLIVLFHVLCHCACAYGFRQYDRGWQRHKFWWQNGKRWFLKWGIRPLPVPQSLQWAKRGPLSNQRIVKLVRLWKRSLLGPSGAVIVYVWMRNNMMVVVKTRRAVVKTRRAMLSGYTMLL